MRARTLTRAKCDGVTDGRTESRLFIYITTMRESEKKVVDIEFENFRRTFYFESD